MQALSAGASSNSFVFELEGPGRHERCILQQFGGGESFVSALGKSEQARAQQAAFLGGVCTPEVLLCVDADDGLVDGFVSRFVAGETLGKRIVGDARYGDARRALPRQCAQALAGIHALDAEALAFLPLRNADTQIAELAARHRHYGEPLPVFEAAFAWLAQHLPPTRRPVVIHGDFRTGNLLVDETGLAGVLDWELAHRGDAMEDLGWLCVRSWRFGRDELPVGGFGRRAELYEHYEQAAGTVVDAAAVRFWELLGTLKWGVICQWFAHRRLRGELTQLEPAVIGRRVSEVELQLLDLLEGRGP
nr:phosphotransferase family protein [Solimonas terrae]